MRVNFFELSHSVGSGAGIWGRLCKVMSIYQFFGCLVKFLIIVNAKLCDLSHNFRNKVVRFFFSFFLFIFVGFIFLLPEDVQSVVIKTLCFISVCFIFAGEEKRIL